MSAPGWEVVADGFTFLEAPRWHQGALYASDFYSHRVLRFSGNEVETMCEVPGQPSGLGFSPDGHLMVVSMTDHRLLLLDDGGLRTVADFSHLCEGLANDMVVDGRGRAFIGNDGELDPVRPTGLVRVDPDGSSRIVATGLYVPNGAVITPAGELWLAETFAARISAWTMGADGALTRRRVLHDFAVGSPLPRDVADALVILPVLPDGMALDGQGRLWVADAKGGGVLCLAGGEVVERVPTSPLTAYGVAIGGERGDQLFVCAAPSLRDLDRNGATTESVLLRRRIE